MGRRFNIGILAHVDAGKTTITEELLRVSGTVRNSGSVDTGTATTDWLEVERRRGISVRTSSAQMTVGEDTVCLVDTPGHVDFAGEVERSLSVLDGAVMLVTAVEGIEAHTRVLWSALRKLNIPTVIVINKIDRTGSDTAAVMEQLKKLTNDGARLMQKVKNEGGDTCSVSVLSGAEREDVLFKAAEFDPALEEALFEEREITEEAYEAAVKKAVEQCGLFPVFLTSAKLGVGMEEVLSAITKYLPDSERLKTEKLSGIVFNVTHDKTMGKAAFVRLFGGTLKSRDTVKIGDKESKITQIRRFTGKKYEDIGVFGPGEVAAVYGLADVKNGDVLGEIPEGRKVAIAEPVLMVQVAPKREEDRANVMEAFLELCDEEPLLDFAFNAETREMYVRITGLIQLEILKEMVSDRFGLDVEFSDPTVIYKETPSREALGFAEYTMPKPCWARLQLKMEPLPPGSGLQFESAIKEGQLPGRYQNHINISVHQTASQGIYGWEVTDAKVTLVMGKHHEIHTHPLDFFVATPMAFLRALTNAESRLLEPYIKAEISAGEEHLGQIIGQIIDMRGEFDTPEISEGQFTLEAVLPVSESVNYPVKFRSQTSGKGIYSASFLEYRPCPPGVTATLPRRGVDPLDVPKWILFCRSAMTQRAD